MTQGKVIARGTIRCAEGELAVIAPAIAEHVRLSRAEPGCIAFDITATAHDPCLFAVVEEFIDRAAFEAHTARTRASDWWRVSQHLPRDIRVFDRPDQSPVPDWTPPPAPPADLALSGRLVRVVRLDAEAHGPALFAANAAEPTGANFDYLLEGPFSELSDYLDFLHVKEGLSDPLFFTILDLETNAPLGIASYLRIAPAAGSIEVGNINFSPALQRSPAATEAMYLMMKWAFEAGYRRYEWKCNAANMRSRRAAERLGFSYEGLFRQALVAKGLNRDTAWFAAIDKEWPALKAAHESWLTPANFDETCQQRLSLWDLTAPIRVADDPARAD